MTKILDAECSAGVVQVDGFVVEADLVTDGIGDSEGFVLLDGETVKYVASNVDDLKEIIDAVAAIVDQLIVVTTSLDAVTISPGSASAGIALLTPLKLQMVALKEVLR